MTEALIRGEAGVNRRRAGRQGSRERERATREGSDIEADKHRRGRWFSTLLWYNYDLPTKYIEAGET